MPDYFDAAGLLGRVPPRYECQWVDWHNGPYRACGRAARIQIRGTWLCHDHYAGHLDHLDHAESCSCLSTL